MTNNSKKLFAALLLLLTALLNSSASPVCIPSVQTQPSYSNENPIWDVICQSQGPDVSPGSPLALQWGSPAYTGTTGAHPTYGYRHTHLLKSLAASDLQVVCRAIIAATTGRRCAYSGPGAALRQAGYDFGQRPLNWKPELPGDAPSGGTYHWWNGNQIEYKNLDEQHCWSFLFDLVDLTKPVVVPFLPTLPGHETVDVRALAAARLTVETDGLAGIARQPYYLSPQFGIEASSDRTYGRLIDWFTRAYKAGVMSEQASQTALQYVQCASKFYGTAPGVAIFKKAQVTTPPIPADAVYFMPAQTAWAAAALYDVSQALGMGYGSLASVLKAESLRMAHWVAESFYPDGRLPWAVSLNQTILVGTGGKPLPSIASQIGLANRHDPGFDAGPWTYRALSCGAKMGDTLCAEVAAKVLQKWQADPAQWTWLVDADWHYAVRAAAVAAGE